MTETTLPSRILFVLSMHRSGSSAVTRALSLTGFSLPKTLIKDNVSNRRGHWESQPIARLNDTFLKSAGLVWSDWQSGQLRHMPAAELRDFEQDIRTLIGSEFPADRPAVLKEPRLCRLVPQYRSALEGRTGMSAVLVVRNPLEVIASLNRRNAMSEAKACLLWLRYVLDSVADSTGLPRAFVAYDALLSNPRETLEQVEDGLGSAFPNALDSVAPDIEAFLSTSLRNHAKSPEDVIHRDLTRGWTSDAYAALRVLTRDPTATAPLTELARIKSELDTAEPLIGHILDTADTEADVMSRRTAALEAAVELKTQQMRLLREAAAHSAPAETKREPTQAAPPPPPAPPPANLRALLRRGARKIKRMI